MVGETRDLETAQIAIRLSPDTWFSRRYTRMTRQAVTRLIDMGVNFLISSTWGV
jgi:type II secretory ATPase GspE/PulE/Tfp pilus assembly ATPase PilB-like protein